MIFYKQNASRTFQRESLYTIKHFSLDNENICMNSYQLWLNFVNYF